MTDIKRGPAPAAMPPPAARAPARQGPPQQERPPGAPAQELERRAQKGLDIQVRPISAPWEGTAGFILGVFAAALVLGYWGWTIYSPAVEPKQGQAKIGELMLHFAVVVVLGTLLKIWFDRSAAQRDDFREKLEKRKEFLRRVRAMNNTIQHARELLIAHGSPRTWVVQLQTIKLLRGQVAEISEDLKASDCVFEQQDVMVQKLEAIFTYLDLGSAEYDKKGLKDQMNKVGDRAGLNSVIKSQEMLWTKYFMGEDVPANPPSEEEKYDFTTNYVNNFENLKVDMRKQVFEVHRSPPGALLRFLRGLDAASGGGKPT